MNLSNISRDSTWIQLDENRLAGTRQNWSRGPADHGPFCSTSGYVHIDTACVNADEKIKAKSITESIAVGVLMAQVPGDNTPFRVKATLSGKGMVLVGYAEKQLEGDYEPIVSPFYIYFENHYDDVIMVPPANLEMADRPLVFAVAALPQIKQVRLTANLSVQNLALKPPTMTMGVS